MKHLRQYIKQILLTEAAKSWDSFPEDVVIVIEGLDWEAWIYYAVVDSATGEAHHITSRDRINDEYGEKIYGKIVLERSEDNGPCDGAMKVAVSRAAEGWGPLLYDVAIEHATINANGLMPDRFVVSSEATNVWNYYLKNRKDVVSQQLDNLQNDLTDIEKDNCDQGVAEEDGPSDDYWHTSSLSKRYTKEPSTINKLKAMGKLVTI